MVVLPQPLKKAAPSGREASPARVMFTAGFPKKGKAHALNRFPVGVAGESEGGVGL